ncbi:MAG TPA: prolipoprotein diacylglyceryl transferase [Solirubrobacterales bacterium]|nr:prolipoprotein diacylglyceryl transferase [Solirubrobacterales bacterium]
MVSSIPSPASSGLHLGPLEVHVYGLLYVVGLAAAVAITIRRWEAQGGSRALVYDVAMWGFPAGVIGGRLYFDLTSSGEVPAHWWGPFAVWDGGMGIWGGIALGTLVGIWRLRRAGVSVAAFMDAAAPALLVGQAIGRVGNYFNQELFGGPTSLPWALQISPAHRPMGYESFATFHPTFLYELIWNLALAAFLVWLGHHRRIRPPGLFALYVAGYSAFRIFEESLRVDPAHHILGLRLNFYVATLLCVAGLVWFARSQGWRPTWKQSRRGAALMLAGGIVLMSGCGGATSRPTAVAPSDSGRSLDSPSSGAAIGQALASVAQFADVGAHSAHGQVQRFGNLAFRLPFPPKADEQGIPL